ncbi:MAG: hypothetical protein SGJ00_01030 [bacterium]|nr:hypothetical protein [bacterium]
MRIALLILVISLFSCKREKENFVVSGVLYKDCSKTIPYANYPLILEYFTKSLLEDPFELTMTTNEKGEFSATYESISDLINGNLSISYVAGFSTTSLISDLPLNKTVNLGNVVKGVNTFYILKIATPKSYSSIDTLYYGVNASNFAPPYMMRAPYIVGPFKDGQVIDTITRLSLLSYDNNSQTVIAPIYKEWCLGAMYHDPKRQNQQVFNISPCTKYQDAVIDLYKSIK